MPSTSWMDRSDGCVFPLGLGTDSVPGIVRVPLRLIRTGLATAQIAQWRKGN